MNPTLRRRLAAVLVVVSLIAWPATQLTVARHEPPFVLALSWFAITLTALDVLATTDVREKEEQ